jgi:regulation of enolase protein 1 (concanavalin A-like superfamily)
MNIRCAALAAFIAAFASTAFADPALTALPGPFETRHPPVMWKATAPDALTMTAGPNTNWFVIPSNGTVIDSAPTLLFQPKGDFKLEAKVSLQPKGRWDSGALVLFIDPENWGKLCLENPDGDGKLSAVHVVTRGVSDDAYTAMEASDNAMYIAIRRARQTFTFSASQDGKTWKVLRVFNLYGDLSQLKAGLLAQSPTGNGITVTFSDIRYTTP